MRFEEIISVLIAEKVRYELHFQNRTVIVGPEFNKVLVREEDAVEHIHKGTAFYNENLIYLKFDKEDLTYPLYENRDGVCMAGHVDDLEDVVVWFPGGDSIFFRRLLNPLQKFKYQRNKWVGIQYMDGCYVIYNKQKKLRKIKKQLSKCGIDNDL